MKEAGLKREQIYAPIIRHLGKDKSRENRNGTGWQVLVEGLELTAKEHRDSGGVKETQCIRMAVEVLDLTSQNCS